jgi:hypothetical protein
MIKIVANPFVFRNICYSYDFLVHKELLDSYKSRTSIQPQPTHVFSVNVSLVLLFVTLCFLLFVFKGLYNVVDSLANLRKKLEAANDFKGKIARLFPFFRPLIIVLGANEYVSRSRSYHLEGQLMLRCDVCL